MLNNKGITKRVNTVVNSSVMKVRKHSPEILVVAGIAGIIVSSIKACKATIKATEVLSDTKEKIDKVHTATVMGVTESLETYTEEDSRKDLATIYIQTGVKITKLYAPSIILGGMSIASILTGNNILRKRNLALSAAYVTVDESFKNYRDRVIEKFGEKTDRELRYGIKAKKFEEVETDSNTGKEKKVKKTIEVSDPNLKSDYAVYFDSRSRNFDKDPYCNRMFLKAIESYANDKLCAQGHLFLNEVLDELDIPRTQAGQIVGWTSNGPDGYVNFRITEVERETENGYHEPVFVLDFNVEGNVWNKI